MSLAALCSRAVFRHIVVLFVGALLVYAFATVHEQWSPMHRWNRAFADASFVLLAFAMSIGPISRLWPLLRRARLFRRESGIYATLLMLVHAVIILDGWVAWDFVRLFGFEFHPMLGSYVMLQHGFGLANLIGLLALIYALVLTASSNDWSVRLLGSAAWKYVQNGAIVLWMLVVVHTAYFLFIHFLSFHRATPDPSPLQWPFVGAVLLVFALRSAAFLRSWRHERTAATKT